MKLGRRPFRASPYSVNWLTTSSPPPTSSSPRFIFPSASGNNLRPTTFSAIQRSFSSVSSARKPTSSKKPRPIRPAVLPPIRTSARLTRCSTTRIGSLHGHRLGQVPRLIHVAAAHDRNMVRQELERNRREDGGQRVDRLRDGDEVVDLVAQLVVPFRHHGDDPPAARLHLLHVRHDLAVDRVVRRDDDDGHVLVDQRDGAVLHLRGRV